MMAESVPGAAGLAGIDPGTAFQTSVCPQFDWE
jgi:hypothetical protein